MLAEGLQALGRQPVFNHPDQIGVRTDLATKGFRPAEAFGGGIGQGTVAFVHDDTPGECRECRSILPGERAILVSADIRLANLLADQQAL